MFSVFPNLPAAPPEPHLHHELPAQEALVEPLQLTELVEHVGHQQGEGHHHTDGQNDTDNDDLSSLELSQI